MGGGLVVTGALGVAEFPGQHALGRGDDEAGHLEAGFFQHLLVFECEGLPRLGDQVAGAGGGLALLGGEEFVGGLARLLDEPGALKLGLLGDGGGVQLGLRELGGRGGGILQALDNLGVALVDGGEDGLDREWLRAARS